MIKKILKNAAGILLVLISVNGNAQVSISGPGCVIPGITYQYVINGNWNSNSSMSACVTGGSLAEGGSCKSSAGSVYTTVSVIWNDTAVMRLEIQSSAGNATLLAKRTDDLSGGTIIDDDKVKVFDSTITTYGFHCDSASGGACVPNYQYQWQRSDNELNWTNITGATGKDLVFTGSVLVNTYFRRVTTESGSRTIAYSDHALLVKEF